MSEDISKHVRKGTTTVGIKCADGIVLGADKRATLGGHIIANKDVDKVFKISDNIAVTIAGTVSDAQLIIKLIMAELRLKKIRTTKQPNVKETASLLGTIVYQNIRKFSPFMAITGFLVGGYDKEGYHLYDVGVDGSVLKHSNYVADGSGFMMAFGVLDTLYKDGIKVNDGLKLAVKALNAAMQRDAATGEGVDVYTITNQGVKKVIAKKIDTTITY
jgi:proteasome beta subunit